MKARLGGAGKGMAEDHSMGRQQAQATVMVITTPEARALRVTRNQRSRSLTEPTTTNPTPDLLNISSITSSACVKFYELV